MVKEIMLRVAEAKTRDVGRSIVRIDRRSMRELDVQQGWMDFSDRMLV